jgi:phage tail tape-measure protein
MRRYLTIATATLIAAGVGIVSKVYAPLAHAAGAYGKGAGFAKQTFKENRKKAPQKALKGSPTRPVGP